MARVRRASTAPELALRKALTKEKIRYRLRLKQKLPGSPDIIIRKHKVAIFVDGCFWHGCPQHGTQAKTNAAFWAKKIDRNKSRDKRVTQALRQSGWNVIRIWEHDVARHLDQCVKRVSVAIKDGREWPRRNRTGHPRTSAA